MYSINVLLGTSCVSSFVTLVEVLNVWGSVSSGEQECMHCGVVESLSEVMCLKIADVLALSKCSVSCACWNNVFI